MLDPRRDLSVRAHAPLDHPATRREAGAMRLLTGLLAVLVVGCASVPLAPRALDEAAKQFRPAAGKANLYVYRPAQFTLSAVTLVVTLDGAAWGTTKAGTYLFGELPAPGRYTLLSQSEDPAPVVLEVEPGQSYFFQQDITFGAVAARSVLHPVDAQTGQAGVLQTQGAVTNPPLPAAKAAGCTKDTDCKGERVCTEGRCVAP